MLTLLGLSVNSVAIAVEPSNASLAPASECKIKDQRIKKEQNNNVGFPLSGIEAWNTVPVTGKAKAVFIPIDFPDVKGTPQFLKMMNSQLSKFQAWYKFFSNGKLNYEIEASDQWVRAPKSSKNYIIAGKHISNGPNNNAQLMRKYAQEFIDAAGNKFDYSGVDSVMFFFPEKIKIEDTMLERGQDLNTPQGIKKLVYFAPGDYNYTMEAKLKKPNSKFWAIWIHEILHSQGLPLHAPANGSRTGIGQEQDFGPSTLDVWETFLLGWLNDDQVYCAPSEKVSEQIVELQPLELKGSGFKTAIVPLDNHRALVVESRRAKNYSEEWDKSSNGVLVYLVDTQNDNDRSQESTGKDSGNDPKYKKWAYYLVPDGRNIPKFNGLNYLETSDVKNWLLKAGDKVTFENVRITLSKSGSKDLIKIQKVTSQP
jgi:M6 family metalloprotease-like protein